MQLLLNFLYIIIDTIFSGLHFSAAPPGIADLVVALVRYGVYANHFIPVSTFINVALYCSGIHISLMIISAMLQLL